MTNNYRVMGTTDITDTCEVCGKKHLKKVVVLRDSEGNDINAGTTCASYLMIGRKDKKLSIQLDRQAKAIDSAKRWFGKGYSPKEVAQGIWNYCGYSVNSYPTYIIIHFAEHHIKVTNDSKVYSIPVVK